jgi:DNA-binding transcriptional LysR family regulator
MKSTPLITNQLEYFTILYRLRSYSLAAKAIPMSLQGLLKSVHTLERDLSVTLFEPTANEKYVPTAFADVLYDLVLEWTHDARGLEEAFAQLKSERRRTIKLGVAIGAMGTFGIDFPDDFSALYPDLALDTFEYPDRIVDNALLNGEFDLALTIAPYNEAFMTLPLICLNTCLWVHASNPLASRDSITVRDLDKQRIGLIGSQFKVNELFMQAFEDEQVTPHSIVSTAEIFWLYTYACEQRGLGIGAEGLKKLFHGCEEVVSIPIEGIDWKCGISYLKSHRLSDDEKVVIEFFKERAAVVGLERKR